LAFGGRHALSLLSFRGAHVSRVDVDRGANQRGAQAMNQPPPPVGNQFAERNAIALKLIFVSFLALLLLVPLFFVSATLRERLNRHDLAVAEITQAWGKSQRFLGPVLVVPYSFKVTNEEWVTKPDGRRVREETTRTVNAEAFFLPEQLE